MLCPSSDPARIPASVRKVSRTSEDYDDGADTLLLLVTCSAD